MANILKRQEIRIEIDGLKVKNPNPKQKAFIQEVINSNYTIDEETNGLVETEEAKNTGNTLIKYMLKNLVEGIEDLSDEEIDEAIKDPSLTLRKINVEFNDIVSEITQETLMLMMTDLKEAKILSETNTVLEKMDTVLKIAKARNAKASNLTVPTKKKRRLTKK